MPTLACNIVDMYVFRAGARGAEFLQLRRAGATMRGTWQPIMGHVEPGESAVACAARETREEAGLDVRGPECAGFWALESVHPFYLPTKDVIMLSPRFAARVNEGWTPTLNHEHDASRWVSEGEIGASFMWPGQRAACREIIDLVLTGVLRTL